MFERVLVPMDHSPLAERALENALAGYPDAEVTVLHVVTHLEKSYGAELLLGPDVLRERAQDRANRLFERAREVATEAGRDVTTVTRVGDPATEIVAYATDHDVDIVVMGSHGRSLPSRILLGSVAQSVLRRSPVPVTIVR